MNTNAYTHQRGYTLLELLTALTVLLILTTLALPSFSNIVRRTQSDTQVYALVNAGVAVGVFPTTGLPMPFISYGGTSLLFTCFLVGVLLNVSSQTVSKDEAMKATAPEYAMRSRFTENFNVGGEIGEEDESLEDTTQVPSKKAPAKKPARTNIVGMDMS